MNKWSCIFILMFGCLSFASAAGFAAVDIPTEIPDEPLDLQAGRIEYVDETIFASGGVTGRFEHAMIRADKISGNPATGDLTAEGNILFERGNIVWQGSDLDYNYLTETGSFGPSSLDFDPVLMSVEHVERAGTNTFLLRGATFTTCPEEHTHYHVYAKEAELVDQKYLKAKGVTVYLGKVPVFYVPYWRQSLNRGIFTFQAGYGSEWGAYGLIKATVPVTQQINWISDLNVYSERGVGFGQGAQWNLPDAVGEFAAFYLKDEDPYKKYAVTEPIGELIEDNRYRFKFNHLQYFDDTQYVNTKLNYLSDPAVLREFFRDEHRSYTQPENYLSWVYGNQYIGTEGFASYRLNDFYGNTDRAEYSLDLYRTRIQGTPFYFQSENSISSLDRVHSEPIPGAVGNYDAARVDSANTLYMPKRIGALSLVPRVGYRGTYYSETANGDDEFRQIPSFGMEASVQATKVLSEKQRWYGKGLRHKIEPYVDYIYENSSEDPSDLLEFDSIDLLQDENKVKIGLRNVLQTKRANRISRFLDLDIYTHYLIENHETNENFDSFFLDARMPLTDRAMFDVSGIVDWNSGEVPFFNSRFSYDLDDLKLSLEHLYRQDRNSLWTPRVDLFPKGNWSLEGYARYEGKEEELEEISVAGYVNWCCMRYGLGYHFYDENEHSVMFSIGLSAFPEARISSSF